MKYRATAVGLQINERSVQSYATHLSVAQEWARKIAAAHHCTVKIYVYEERLVETIEVSEVPDAQLGQSMRDLSKKI